MISAPIPTVSLFEFRPGPLRLFTELVLLRVNRKVFWTVVHSYSEVVSVVRSQTMK